MPERPLSAIPLKPEASPDEPISDALLVQTCQLGFSKSENTSSSKSAQAFRELTLRYGRLVYHFIYKMTQNKELSEDITQDVFLKAYQNLYRFDTSRPFKPWLMRIASNTAISALRKKENTARAQAISLDVLAEQGWQLGDSSENDSISSTQPFASSEPLEQDANAELVRQTLAKMDARYRQILILRYFQDLSYDEIAQTLGMPLNTVRTWIRRGLEQFKKNLQDSEI